MNTQIKARITDPKYKTAFILVTSLFFMWGLSYGLVDVLNKHFQETLNVSKAQSGLIQAAYFGAYFIIALPAGMFMEKRGYKSGIILGLFLYAIGALLFVPATSSNNYYFFLFALFVLALGLGCLETAANPYSAALGDPNTAETRLNFSQSFNGLGQFLGPMLGGLLFFKVADVQEEATSSQFSVMITYVVIAAIVLFIMFLIAKTPLPDLRSHEAEQDAQESSDGKKQSLLAHKEFIFGVFTQFVYVAAQVGIGAFFINLTVECWPDATSQTGAFLLSIAMLALMVGRFVSTGIMTKVSPQKMLVIYGVACVILSAIASSAINYVSVIAVIITFFFISIMFPTIFAMSVKNLGSKTKLGSSFIIMSIVGGAIMPYFMGKIADHAYTSIAYILPLVCFAIVAIYGIFYKKLAAIN
ncbi:L-fucose:H+ symporter permease [Gilliamella sp. wkB112]|uniref:L-fucose:H+ symporter permease n=1 Tax=Gilliamella sp. wkB112 TaxID=3120257 RepID=UPI00080E12A3|nr:L-fucose:H+ symporter permease [Gilliamella apicola]OCG01259.1 L-fucose:H+ symporter permease [Gilliamella apicola]